MSGLAFLSGGTGMRGVSRELASRGLFSTHIITTFDSGGSSRQLRLAFHMPAVGDLRNRLLALASPASAAACALLNQRLPQTGATASMALACLQNGSLPSAEYSAISLDLRSFLDACPGSFDANGASIGNLAITGAYLRFGRQLPLAVQRYADLLRITGQVLPVSGQGRQLGARLANGRDIAGQHLFRHLPAPVAQLYLTGRDGRPLAAALLPAAACALASASLICLPMGSFYSSIMANLLPDGAGRAIARSAALKLFIPNTGHDPELFDLDLPGQARALALQMARDAPGAAPGDLLNAILVDPCRGRYPGGYDARIKAALQKQGLRIIERPAAASGNVHNSGAVADVLEELCRKPF